MRATVQQHGALVRMMGYSDTLLPSGPPTLQSFQAFVDSQPMTRVWCVQHMMIDGDGSVLVDAIRNHEAVMVSDGSFKDQRGTAAMILQGATPIGEARAMNRVPGEPEDHDSFQSKLSGLIGIATLVELLCEYFNITGGAVEVACDGLSALNNVFDLQRHVSTKTPHYDLVVATRQIIQSSAQLTWFYRHVRSHEDDLREYEELDRWETLNIEVDDSAKTYLNQEYDTPNPSIAIQDSPWTISLNGRKVVRKLKDLSSLQRRPQDSQQ
jgi:hypothetical protein